MRVWCLELTSFIWSLKICGWLDTIFKLSVVCASVQWACHSEISRLGEWYLREKRGIVTKSTYATKWRVWTFGSPKRPPEGSSGFWLSMLKMTWYCPSCSKWHHHGTVKFLRLNVRALRSEQQLESVSGWTSGSERLLSNEKAPNFFRLSIFGHLS